MSPFIFSSIKKLTIDNLFNIIILIRDVQITSSTQYNSLKPGDALGNYMLLNATAGYRGRIGTLVSHTIENTGPLCTASFWYNMKGTGSGKLQVCF